MKVTIDKNTLSTLNPEQRANFDFYQNPDYAHQEPPYKKDTIERAKYVNEIFKLEQEARRH